MFNNLPYLLAEGEITWLVVAGVCIVAGLIFFAFLIAAAAYGKLWFQAFMSGADVSIWSLIGMGFRQVKATVIVTAKIMCAQAGLNIDRRTGISTSRLEAHYLAGGDVMKVVHAIIAAHRANIDLDFDRAAAIDLAGRDVVDAVRTSVYPKVIDCPDPQRSGKTTLSAIAKNGVELRVIRWTDDARHEVRGAFDRAGQDLREVREVQRRLPAYHLRRVLTAVKVRRRLLRGRLVGCGLVARLLSGLVSRLVRRALLDRFRRLQFIV